MKNTNYHRVEIEVLDTKLIREEEAKFKVSHPESAVRIIKDFIGDKDREYFIILCLNTKNIITGIHTVSVGSLSSSIVHPREVFKVAILNNSASIIAAHNHPSGDTTPSKEDVLVSKRLIEAGKILGIELLDHIIVGDGYTSLKTRNMI